MYGRIEIDPARSRKIDLQPGMCRSAADHLGRSSVRRKDVATNKPGGEASERTQSIISQAKSQHVPLPRRIVTPGL